MTICTIEALNYRCLRYVRQELDRFHVLVGPNASGKTTFLEVIRFLSALLLRRQALSIRAITLDILVHATEHDPACRLRSHEVLRSPRHPYSHALVVFDRHGCGREAASRGKLKAEAGLWNKDHPKPADPKRAVSETLFRNRKPWSAAMFGELARRVTFRRCADPAFHKLTATLRRWYPAHSA